jgi:hypothetical protein
MTAPQASVMGAIFSAPQSTLCLASIINLRAKADMQRAGLKAVKTFLACFPR